MLQLQSVAILREL